MENFHRFNPLKHSTVLPHAFTEQGFFKWSMETTKEADKGEKDA